MESDKSNHESKSDGSKSDGSKSDGSRSDGSKSDGSKADGSETVRPKADGKKNIFRFFIGLVVSGLFMVLAARNVDWSSSLEAMKEANPLWMAGGVACLLLTYVFFAGRWVCLARSSFALTLRDAFSFIMIGHLGNTVMPLRLGDVTRGVLVARTTDGGMVTVFTTMFLEKLLDLVAILFLVVWVMLHVKLPPVVQTAAGFVALSVGLSFGAVLVFLFFPIGIKKRLYKLERKLPKKLVSFIRNITEQAGRGLSAFKNIPVLVFSLAFTIAAWITAAAGTLCYMKAFDFSLSWNVAVFVLVVINLGSAIPSSPGFIGVYHYLAVFALGYWGVQKSEALGYALSTHLLNISTIIIIGGLCLWIKGIRYQQLKQLKQLK